MGDAYMRRNLNLLLAAFPRCSSRVSRLAQAFFTRSVWPWGWFVLAIAGTSMMCTGWNGRLPSSKQFVLRRQCIALGAFRAQPLRYVITSFRLCPLTFNQSICQGPKKDQPFETRSCKNFSTSIRSGYISQFMCCRLLEGSTCICNGLAFRDLDNPLVLLHL